jgi:hypothetical protein
MSTEQKIKSKYQRHVSEIHLLSYILLLIRVLILIWNSHRSVVRRREEWRSRIGHFRQWQWKRPFLGSKTPLLPLTRTYKLLNPPPSEIGNLSLTVRGRNSSLFTAHRHLLRRAVYLVQTTSSHLHPPVLVGTSCPWKWWPRTISPWFFSTFQYSIYTMLKDASKQSIFPPKNCLFYNTSCDNRILHETIQSSSCPNQKKREAKAKYKGLIHGWFPLMAPCS